MRGPHVRAKWNFALPAWWLGGVLAGWLAGAGGCATDIGRRGAAAGGGSEPLRVVVMDPLADRLACACVQGYAQRKYDQLAEFLAKRLARPVQVTYGVSLTIAQTEQPGRIDLIIGKQSAVLSDAAARGLRVRPIARLTDKQGSPDLTGLFVVRDDDAARTIADLKGRRLLLGPREEDEKHAAVLAALDAASVPRPAELTTAPDCAAAALAVLEQQADAAVISSYAFPLLEGCKTIPKGALRVIGQTGPVPFVTVCATPAVDGAAEQAVVAALLAVGRDRALLRAMESKDGFVRVAPPPASAPVADASAAWTDWRGPGRDGLSPQVPARLPATATYLWRKPLTRVGLSGVVATARYVIVADKSADERRDIFRCLAAESGQQLWGLEYDAPGSLDYSNSPRATPVIRDGLVYLLGALGHLHCVELETGKIVWKRNLIADFGAKLVTWGMCSTPLVVDDKLIVNPGAAEASLVALERRTGAVVWKSPGAPAAYASFIVGTFGGVRQIVGYDAESLGGWDPQTGRRLWRLEPEEGDFNVPTPVNVGGRLLVSTENNRTRLYGFDAQGQIEPKPLAISRDLRPDSSTPVVVDGLVFGCTRGLFCLDVNDGLRTCWSADDPGYDDYVSLIGGNGRVLIMTTGGELLLVRTDRERYTLESRLRIFAEADVWSYPALVGDRLYVRNKTEIVCLRLDE